MLGLRLIFNLLLVVATAVAVVLGVAVIEAGVDGVLGVAVGVAVSVVVDIVVVDDATGAGVVAAVGDNDVVTEEVEVVTSVMVEALVSFVETLGISSAVTSASEPTRV